MPSVSEKQRRFMGAELARKRSGEKTRTGMSEEQLGEFAHSVKKHGSLLDIEMHEELAQSEVVCDSFVHPMHKGYGNGGENTGLESAGAITWGALDPPRIDGADAEPFERGKQSANRDAGQGIHFGAPVDYFGPDTDYRAEEIDPSQYGRSYDPIPYRDFFKTEDKMSERTFRLREQDEYDQNPQPGMVTDSQPMSEAYGAVNFRGAGPDKDDGEKAGSCDYRSFESQMKFARANKDRQHEYSVDVSGLDEKLGEDIR